MSMLRASAQPVQAKHLSLHANTHACDDFAASQHVMI
jgi:hypothetical protein